MLSLPGKPFFASPSSLPWGFTLLYQRPHIYTYCFLAKCTLCFLNNGKFLKRKRLLRPLGDDFTSLKIIMSKWAAGLRILQTLSKTSIQMFVIPQKILGFSQFTMLITLSRFQTVPLASRNLPASVSNYKALLLPRPQHHPSTLSNSKDYMHWVRKRQVSIVKY